METWRLLHTWDRDPAFNMGLDEACMLVPQARPTLRFYTWAPETLSLGYFQRVADVPNLAHAPAAVRRITGGGAIYHAQELTFCVSVPDDHALYRGAVRSSYERVHGAIAATLAELNVPARPRGSGSLPSDRPVGGMCFEESTDVDLAWGEAKGVGSAQRRAKGRIMHHGSIKLGRSSLDANVAAIWDHSPDLTAAELAQRLAHRMAADWNLEWCDEPITEAEAQHALEHGPRFASEAFLRRR